MQSATRSVDKKKSTINKETKRKNTKKKQLQTSASRGSYIKNVKKKKENLTKTTEASH